MTHHELRKLFQALSELENGTSNNSSRVSELTALKWLSLHKRSSIQLRASYSREMSELEFCQFISAHLDPSMTLEEIPHKETNDVAFFTPTLALQSSVTLKRESATQPTIETSGSSPQTDADDHRNSAEFASPQHLLQKGSVSGQDLASSTILALNSRPKQKPKERKMAQAVARLQELDPANNHAHFQKFTTWLKGHQAQHIKIVSLNL